MGLSRHSTPDIFDYVPAGTVLPFSSEQAPTGWAMCDGAEVSRESYSGLFNVLGETYGVGDGSTTFNLPDYRGIFLRAMDDMNTAQGAAGKDPDVRTIGSQQLDGTRSGKFSLSNGGVHSHRIWRSAGAITSNNPPSYNGGTGFGVTGEEGVAFDDYELIRPIDGTHSHSISGGDSETVPLNKVINYIIKL